MAADINVTGVVFGTIFGALFLITCIISAVKAVKDRKRIKERIEAKRRQRLENSAYDNPQTEVYQHSQINGTPVSSAQRANGSKSHIYEHVVNVHKPVPRTSSSEGIQGERQTFKHKIAHPSSSVPNMSQMTRGSDPNILEIKQYYAEPMVVTRNITRRMSYDVAVGEFSFLNRDAPIYASSNTINNMYSQRYSAPVVVFDNKAYDGENQI